MRTLCILVVQLFLAASFAFAQKSWQVLPDTGLNIHPTVRHRYEDVYFTDQLTGIAVSADGYIYKTVDAGRNWKPTFAQPADAAFRSVEFLDDKLTGIVGSVDTNRAVYRTTDGGDTWVDVGAALVDTIANGSKAICGLSHVGNTFFGVGAWFTLTSSARFFKSTDKGLSWTCNYLDKNLISSAVDVYFRTADTGFITGGCFLNTGKAASVVLKTTDGGQSWQRVFADTTLGGRIWRIQALTPKLLVGSIEPIYSTAVAMIRSVDGGDTWSIINTGIYHPSTKLSTQGIGFIDSLHGWLGGWYTGIYETIDGGQSWSRINFGENVNRIFVVDSNHVYAGGKDMYFYGGQLPYASTSIVRKSLPEHTLFDVAPNPTQGTIKIRFHLTCATHVQLIVYSVDSKRSWNLGSFWLPAGNHAYTWDGSAQPAGNYVVSLGTNEAPPVGKQFVLMN